MPSLIDHYRRKYPTRLGNRTDEEIALALVYADPSTSLHDEKVRDIFNAAKSRRNIDLGIPFDAHQVHESLMQEAEPRRRVVTTPENPTPRVAYQDNDIGFRKAISNAWMRGRLLGKQSQLMGMGLLQRMDDELDMNDIRAISEVQRELQSLPQSKEYREFIESEGFWNSLGEFMDEPLGIVTEAVVESMSGLWKAGAEGGFDADGNYVPGKVTRNVAAGAAGGAAIGTVAAPVTAAAGAAWGAISGVGVSSHALESAGAYLDSFREAGVDTTNPQALFNAINDEKLHKKARDIAQKHGLAVGVFDSVSAGLAGRGRAILMGARGAIRPVAPKLAAAPISRIGVGATELGMQMGFGMAGETIGQKWSKPETPLHWPSVLIEGFAELGPGAVYYSAGTVLRHGRKGRLEGDPNEMAEQAALAKLIKKRADEGVSLGEFQESVDKADYFFEAEKLGVEEQQLKDEYKQFAGTIYRDTNDGTFSEKWEMSEEELAEVQRDEGLTIGVWKENSSARFPDADILEFKGADRFKKARAWVSANRPKKKGRWNYTDDGRRFSILGGSLKPEQYAEIKAHIDKYGEESLTEGKEDAAPAQGPQPTAEEAVLEDSPTGIDWTTSQEGSVKEGLPEITTEELESEVVKNKEWRYGKKGSKEVSDEDAIAHAHQREWKVATDEAATVYDFPKGINKELLGNTLMHSDNNQLTDKAYDLLVAYNPELSAIPLNPSKPQASKWHIVLGALSNFPAVDIAAFVAEKAVQHPTEAHLTGAVHRKVAPPDFSKEDTTGIDIPFAKQQELPGMGGARGKRGKGAPIPKAGAKPTAGQLGLPGLEEDIAPLEKPPTVEELREREVELEEELSKAPKLEAEPEAAKAKAKKGKAVPVPTAERVGETIPVLVPARGPIKWKTIPKQTMGDVKTVAEGTRSRKEIATELKEVQGKIAELEAPKEGASIAQQVQWEIDRIDKRHERLSKAQVAGEELVLEIQEAPMVEPTLNQQYRKLVLSIRSLELRLAEEKKKFDKKGQKEGTKLLENKLAEVRRNREILGKELGIEIRDKLTRDPGEVLAIETAQWMQPTPAEEALELNREQRKWNDGPDLSEADTLFVHEWVQGNKERDKYAKPARGKESEGLKGYPTWLEVLRRNALSLTFSTERAKPIGGRSSSVAYDRAATLMQQTREELQAIFDGRATMKGGMTGPAAAHNFAHFGSFKFLRHRYFDLLKGLKAHKRFDTKVKVEIRDNETVFDQMDRVQVEMDRALSGEAGVSRSADQRAQLAASGKLSKALSIFLEKIQNLVVGQRKFDLMKRPDSTETSELQSEQLYRLINNYLFEEAANWLYKDAVSFKKIKSLKARIRKLQAEERELREQAIDLGRIREYGGEVVGGRTVVKRTTVWKKLPGQRITRRPMTDEEIDTWERENTPISNVETKERFGYRNIKEGLKKGAVKPYRGPDGKGPIQPGRYEQIDVHIQPYARPDVWVPIEEVENVTNEELKKITLRQGVVNEQIYENNITLRGLERDKDKAGKAHDVGAMFKRIQKEAKIIEGKRAEAVLAGKLPRFEELSAPVAIARYLKGYNPGQAVTVDAKGNLHAIPREHLREAVGSLKKSLERYMREIADSMDISSQDVRMAEKKSLLSHASEMDISEVKEREGPRHPMLSDTGAMSPEAIKFQGHLLDTMPTGPVTQETYGPTGKKPPGELQRLTKKLLFSLKEGTRIMANEFHEDGTPTFMELVAPLNGRQAQWERVRDAFAKRRQAWIEESPTSRPSVKVQASMSLLEAEKAISEALDKTFENKELGLGPMKRLFHDIILPAAESTGQDVRVHMVGRNKKSMLSDVAGLYFNNNIFLTPLDYADPVQSYNVLIHESIHMLTDGFARDHESGKQKWVEMEKVFNKAKEVAGKEHIKYADGTQVKVSEAFEYQLSNMKEFVAHAFEHNEFQQWLANVVYEDGAATKTALEWFVHAIKGAFARLGISVSNESTLLDEVVKQTYKALSTRPIETMQTAPLADAVIPMIGWANQFVLFDEARGGKEFQYVTHSPEAKSGDAQIEADKGLLDKGLFGEAHSIYGTKEFQYDDSLSNPMGTMYDLGYRDVSTVETPEVAKLKGMTFKSWISKLSYTKVPDPSPEEQLKHINYILDVMKEKEDLALARATSLAEEEGPDVEPMAYFEDELKNIIESGEGLQWMKRLVALVLGTRGSLRDKLTAGPWSLVPWRVRTDVVGFHELKAQVEHEKSNLEAILEYPGTMSPELEEFYKAKPKAQEEAEIDELIASAIDELEAKLQSGVIAEDDISDALAGFEDTPGTADLIQEKSRIDILPEAEKKLLSGMVTQWQNAVLTSAMDLFMRMLNVALPRIKNPKRPKHLAHLPPPSKELFDAPPSLDVVKLEEKTQYWEAKSTPEKSRRQIQRGLDEEHWGHLAMRRVWEMLLQRKVWTPSPKVEFLPPQLQPHYLTLTVEGSPESVQINREMFNEQFQNVIMPLLPDDLKRQLLWMRGQAGGRRAAFDTIISIWALLFASMGKQVMKDVYSQYPETLGQEVDLTVKALRGVVRKIQGRLSGPFGIREEISLSESRRHTRINVSDPNITPESAVAAAEQVMEPAPEKESQMSWWERFYKGVISKSRVFGVAERKVLESRNYSGAPLLATEENHELLNGAPQKAQHKNDQFNAAIKSIIGRGSKIEKDFNTYLFLHRTHTRLAKQEELDMRRREILDSVGIEVNADGTIKETEETERMLERLSSEERIELVTLMVSSKKVAEWNNNSVLKGLSGLRSKLGEEKMEEFKRAKDVYNDFLSESLFGLVESGRINMNAYLKILDSSDFYAPFYVAQYFNIKDKSLLEYIKGIQSPDFRLVPLMDAARFKIYTSMMAAEYNKFGLLLTKLAEIDTQGVEIQEFSAEREPSDAVIEYNKSIDDAIAVAKEKLENAKSQVTRDKISSEIADLQRKMRMAGKKAIPEGWETIEVYVEGYRHTYIMKEEVASVLKYDGGVAKSGPTLFAEFASDTFKMGATGLNVFFQTFNALLVDPLRLATTSRYGLGLKDFKYGVPVNFAMQYLRGFAASLWANVPLSRGLLQKDKLLGRMMGQPELLVQEFIDSGAAGSTISDYLQREKVRNPVKKHKGWRGTLDPLFEAGGLVRDKLNTVGKIMEYTAKLAGMRRGLDIDGAIKLREKMDNTEDGPALYAMQRELAAKMRKIAIEVRNYVGSPDFARRGTITDAMRLNLVFMFFNARVQGVERDMKRLSDAFRVGNDKDAAKLGAKTIFRLSSLAAVPTIAFWAMNRRKDYDEDYDEISPEDKRHYFHIPLDSFFTHPWTGEKVREYIRIPRRETYGMVSMLIEKGLDHFYKKDPKAVEEMIAATMENLMPINVQSAEGGLELDPAGRFQSILSSLNPVLKTPMELASNMNFYHHSPILSREAKAAPSVEQYYNNTPQLYRKLAKVLGGSPLMWGHGLRGFTGGMVTQFIPEEPVAGRSPLMSSPFTAPAKRLFRSKFIAPTEGMREMEQFAEQEAGIALHRKRLVDKFWGETHDLAPRDRARAAMDMLRAMPQTHDTLLVKRALVQRFRDLNLSREEKMLKSLPVNARSAWLINKLSSMPVDERTEYWQGLVGKRIVTQGVAAQMIRELRPYGGAQSLFPTSP